MGASIIFDEDLSPQAAIDLCARGHDATSNRAEGLLGCSDHQLFAWAQGRSRIVATANCADFLELAHNADLHCGVILLLDGQLSAAEQEQAVFIALEHIYNETGTYTMQNQVLRVEVDGTLNLLELPDPV